MTSPAFLLLVPLLGVSFGYEPSSDSDTGYDYTVQVEPELLDQIKAGGSDAIETNIPPEVTPIRRIRVVVGTGDLPKRLRPVERTTYRQDLDGSAPPIDMLAQTGPAGGFGRNSTGFNGSATRGATAPTTTPSIGSQYRTPPANDIRGQLDQGFQAAENGLANTRDAVRNGVNTVGQTGQQMIDNTRQTISDIVAPPQNPSFSMDNTPMENFGGRVQDEFRSGTQAVRDSFDRTAQNARDAFTTDRYNTPAAQPGVGDTPRWTADATAAAGGYPYQSNERSVLDNRVAPQQDGGGLTAAEREMLERIDRDRQLQQERERQLAAQRNAAQVRTADADLRFPSQPMQTIPPRNEDLIVPFGNRPQQENLAGGMQTANNNATSPAISAAASQVDPNFGTNNAAINDNFGNQGNSAATDNFPQITRAGGAQNQQVERPNVANWLNGTEGDAAPENSNSNQSSTPVWLLGWTIAVGSVVTNLFQWLNIVDMRNKYRVALRRGSPNFARSMAA